MTSIKLMLNRERALNSGRYPLVFQIIHMRKRKLIYTLYKLFDDEFDPATQKIVYAKKHGNFSSKEVVKFNKHLAQERRRLENVVRTLEQKVDSHSVQDIYDEYNNKGDTHMLLQYMDMRIDQKQGLDRSGIAAAYKSTRSSLAKFLENSDINVTEITPRFVREYEDFLRKSHLTDNTISFYMRNLRTIYNRIVEDGFEPRYDNLFKSIKTSPAKTVKRALDKGVMKRLSEMQFEKSEFFLELSRDLFLFSFYTRGMAFVDIAYLRYSDVTDVVITYQRHKTGQTLSVGVTPQLQAIMDKYYFGDRGYVMPILNKYFTRPLYRQYRSALARNIRHLKILGERLNLQSRLTTYVARHSWATIAKKQGVAVTIISEGLGHTSEKTTRIYLKELDRSILDKANETVIDF